jgi:hypothetical protein
MSLLSGAAAGATVAARNDMVPLEATPGATCWRCLTATQLSRHDCGACSAASPRAIALGHRDLFFWRWVDDVADSPAPLETLERAIAGSSWSKSRWRRRARNCSPRSPATPTPFLVSELQSQALAKEDGGPPVLPVCVWGAPR